MAAGDIVVFDQFMVDLGNEVHNLGSDTIRLGLIDSTQTPAATSGTPRWGAGGGTNFSTDEVAAGGNYSSGGPTLSGVTYALSGGAAVLDDSGNVSITQNGSNPTDARWGIIYNDTDTSKRCIAYVDLGAVVDLSAGDFSITWNASGIFTIDQA